jgi:hypothetical protein
VSGMTDDLYGEDATEDVGPRSRFEGQQLLVSPGTSSATLNRELEGADAQLAALSSVDARDCILTDWSFLDKCVALSHLNINGNGGVSFAFVLVRLLDPDSFLSIRTDVAASRGVAAHDSDDAECIVSAH